MAFSSGVGFGALYLLVMSITRATMRRNGLVIARAQKARIQAAQEGLGGIRDVLLDRSQPVFVHRFASVEGELRRAQSNNSFLSAAPRFVIEGLGLVLIAGLAVLLSQRAGGLAAAIPVLGALALGAQRMVPLLQQIYAGWAAWTSGAPSRSTSACTKGACAVTERLSALSSSRHRFNRATRCSRSIGLDM